jgi:putative intracellular protease/amidase
LLSDVQLPRGAGEAAAFGDGGEVAHLAQVGSGHEASVRPVDPGVAQAEVVAEQQLALVRPTVARLRSPLAITNGVAPAPREWKETEMATVQGADQHHEVVDVTTSKRPTVLMVVANPTTSTTTGWPIGFWAAELTHPYYEFSQVRYDVTIASPDGGKVEVDALSDPRDESRWSADDLISMGFLNTPELTALLEDTPRLADLDSGEFDALVVCGGNAPMFQFRQNEGLKQMIAAFYEAEKPTAVLCHGVAALIDVQLSDGSYLVEGKTVTGFANVEEDYVDRAVGLKVMPYRIEDELRKRGANYIQGGLLKAFAVRDGRLITGQQQYSGAKVAQLVVTALGT